MAIEQGGGRSIAMNAPKDRRFTLLDVMIIVAATAAGLAVIRWSLPDTMQQMGIGPSSRFRWPRIVHVIGFGAIGTSPLAAFWSLALVAMRLRQPRPSWRRLRVRPGLVAGVAAAIGSVFGALIVLPYYFHNQPRGEWALLACYPMGYAVAGAWAALILAGRWRPTPDWFDRIGRALGVYWIALFVLFILMLQSMI